MNKRDARYEFIRVVSMFLVIGVHSLALVPRNSGGQILAGHFLTTLFFLCNGLFFMLSGKFSLGVPCRTLSDYLRYYGKRLCSLGVPVLFFMLLRTMHNSGWWPGYLASEALWHDYLSNVLGGFRACEYWFLYPLAGLLAAAPFLGRFLQSASKTELLVLLGLGLGFNALTVYLPALGLPFGWEFPLGNWFVLFMLGYALERLVNTPAAEASVMALGACCFLLTVFQKHIGFTPGVNDLAPAYAGIVSGAFLALKRLYRSNAVADRIVITIGKHSLSVYLIHSMFLSFLEKRIPTGNFLLQLISLLVLTFLISFPAAMLLDCTIIRLFQYILRRLFRLTETRVRP